MLVLTASVLALTGCGDAGSGPRGDANAVSPSAASASRLTVTVRADADAEPRTWTLRCAPPGGDHPAPAAACTALAKAGRWHEPVPKDRACTMIHGGPQTAAVTGVWRGEEIDASFSREGGCEIARWSKIAPVLEPR